MKKDGYLQTQLSKRWRNWVLIDLHVLGNIYTWVGGPACIHAFIIDHFPLMTLVKNES